MSKIKTLTPLLFDTKANFSDIIRFFEWLGNGSKSRISHIEFAINPREHSLEFRRKFNLEPDEIYTCRSTSHGNVKDVFGQWADGIAICNLRSTVDAHKGQIYARDFFVGEYGHGLPGEDIQHLELLIDKMYGTPYERKFITQLALAALDRTSLKSKRDLSSIFCSEWLSYVLNVLGYEISDEFEQTPKDYEFKRRFLRGMVMTGKVPIEEVL